MDDISSVRQEPSARRTTVRPSRRGLTVHPRPKVAATLPSRRMKWLYPPRPTSMTPSVGSNPQS